MDRGRSFSPKDVELLNEFVRDDNLTSCQSMVSRFGNDIIAARDIVRPKPGRFGVLSVLPSFSHVLLLTCRED